MSGARLLHPGQHGAVFGFAGWSGSGKTTLVEKIISLRIFKDNLNKMNLSVSDVQGSILAISQFTLCASTNHGRRPSYFDAMAPNQSKNLYDYLTDKLKKTGLDIQTGIFGADMEVDLINDGPVTLVLDSKKT